MSEIIITDELKDCVKSCYSTLHPTLVEKTLSGCDCCAPNYELVDMGEAGIWAKYPIGVSEWNSDWENQIKYFAWGETEGYTKSQLGVDKEFDWSDYKWCEGGEDKLTKYCGNTSDGITDYLSVLLPEDDACTVNMGGNWRMPTTEEFQKLDSLCNNEWVTNYNGVSELNGRLFKLKTDESKQLFFPVNGKTGLISKQFWSSSLNISTPRWAFYLDINTSTVDASIYYNRCRGYSVIGILDSGQ